MHMPICAAMRCVHWVHAMMCEVKIKSLASLAQLAEHALRKRTVVGSIPTGGSCLRSSVGSIRQRH